MFCRQCGAQIPQGARFCKSCGAPVPEAQGSEGQVAQVATRVTAPRRPTMPLVIGAICVVLLAAGLFAIRALTKPRSAGAPSGSQATENAQPMSDDSNANAQYDAASSWIADVVKFENATIKTTSYGRAYLTVDIHNTSDNYVPYVFFDGTVKATFIDEYGEGSPHECELMELMEDKTTDIFLSVHDLKPQETRTVTHFIVGDYHESGDFYSYDGGIWVEKDSSSSAQVESKVTAEQDGYYFIKKEGVVFHSPESFSDLTIFHDTDYYGVPLFKKGDDFGRWADSYAARKLQIELKDLSREQDENSETIDGNIRVTNSTPYYLKSCNIRVSCFNDRGEEIDTTIYELPARVGTLIEKPLSPGESVEVPLDRAITNIDANNPLKKIHELRVIDVHCDIDEDKCAEKGVDMTVPEELLKP